MPGLFPNPLSAAPLVFALSLSLGQPWAASAGSEPVRIEVFTVQDLPIQAVEGGDPPSASVSTTIEVYELDGIETFEAVLSEQLPTDPDAARRAAQGRISQPDSSQIDQVAHTATGLVKVAEYGIDRYPAIVFDGEAVVYGITNIGEALHLYRKRQGRVFR